MLDRYHHAEPMRVKKIRWVLSPPSCRVPSRWRRNSPGTDTHSQIERPNTPRNSYHYRRNAMCREVESCRTLCSILKPVQSSDGIENESCFNHLSSVMRLQDTWYNRLAIVIPQSLPSISFCTAKLFQCQFFFPSFFNTCELHSCSSSGSAFERPWVSIGARVTFQSELMNEVESSREGRTVCRHYRRFQIQPHSQTTSINNSKSWIMTYPGVS